MSNSCEPVDCSLLGSSVHGILQARVLEWVVISFSRGSSQPRDWTQISWDSLLTELWGKPICHYMFVQSKRICNSNSEISSELWTFGWLWCISVGSSLVTNVPLQWIILKMGEAVYVWRQRAYGESRNFPLIFYLWI